MNWKIILILLFGLFLRLFWLNYFPTGITNDELHFVLNAKAVWLNGTDIRGQWHPLSFTTIPHETSSEIPFLLISPIIGPLQLNLLNARLPFVFISVLTILFLYLLVKKLLGERTAFFVALVSAVNPWSIYVSRTSFDAPLAVFFFVLSFYLLVSLKKWRILFAFIPLSLAFYSYIGTKIIFLPFVFIILTYLYLKQRRYLKQYFLLFFLCSLITFRYFLIINRQPGTRLAEIASPFSPKIALEVDLERSQLISSPLTSIFSNKITLYLRHFITKYLDNFSPRVFFLNGDETFYISLWQHGYFYYLDFFFLIFGLLILHKTNRRLCFLVISLILISPLPAAIRADKMSAFAFNSALQYPFLFILLGIGLSRLPKKLYLPIFIIYLFSLLNFYYIYFFRYSVYQPEGFDLSSRLVSKYLAYESPLRQHIFVLTPRPEVLFRSYLFYTDTFVPQTTENVFTINNITFTSDPQNINLSEKDTLVAHYSINLSSTISDTPKIIIPRLSDNFALYKIYQPQTCFREPLSFHTPVYTLKDFDLDRLSVSLFCQKFFIRP